MIIMKSKQYLLAIILMTVSSCIVSTAHAATFTVTNRNNTGSGSLSNAISSANSSVGPDTILFDIPSVSCGDSCLIQPTALAPLPHITDDETTINGYSQPGSSSADGSTPAVLKIEIRGTSAGAVNGLNITSSSNEIRGLIINSFEGNGIAVGNSSSDNIIQGNHVGTNFDGTADMGNDLNGIFIAQGATSTIIGHDPVSVGSSNRNVISGNGWSGIEIHGAGTSGNKIYRNYIGTTSDGSAALGNTMHGIRIYGEAQENDIEQSVISGNLLDGVHITGNNTNTNTVHSCVIGLSPVGNALGNGNNGVTFSNGAQENRLYSSIIGKNNGNGVDLSGENTDSNTLFLNHIGITPSTLGGEGGPPTDSQPAGNGGHGIQIDLGASENYIGYCADGTVYRNYIAENTRSGILLTGVSTSENSIIGNMIGTNDSGTIAMGNGEHGIAISIGSQSNTVGGSLLSCDGKLGNLISGNDGDGILIWQANTNQIIGNTIGLNQEKTSALGNAGNGITLASGSIQNQIQENIVSGNGSNGVNIIEGSNTTRISGNYIGTNGSNAPLGNLANGIYILATSVHLMATSIGMENIIAHNNNGITIDGSLATGHRIYSNSIHSNSGKGIQLLNGANRGVSPPVITSNSLHPATISGTACVTCLVQIFSNDTIDGQGKIYLGERTTDSSGNFSATLLPAAHNRFLTATATDGASTSEFSQIYSARMPFSLHLFLPAITGAQR